MSTLRLLDPSLPIGGPLNGTATPVVPVPSSALARPHRFPEVAAPKRCAA